MKAPIICSLAILHCLCFCLLVTVSPSYAQARKKLTAAQIAQKFKYSVFTIKTEKGTGTAFKTDFDYILTCYHVIKGSKEVALKVEGKEDIPLDMVAGFNSKTDTFSFRFPYKFGVGAPVSAGKQISNGEKLYVVGSPRGLEQTISEGILSGKRVENGVKYLQISAPISPGSSGSPVINEYGEVIGIVVGSLKDAQQLNFAVDIWDALNNGMSIPYNMVSGLLDGNDKATIEGETTPTSDETGVASEMEAFDTLNNRFKGVELERRALSDTPDFSIAGMNVSKDVLSEVSEEDIELWVIAELSRSAPRAAIVSQKDQNKILEGAEAKTVLGHITKGDNALRRLIVTVDSLKDKSGGRTYMCRVSLLRPNVLATGINLTSVYSTSTFGFFNTGGNPSLVIRDAVLSLIREFAKQWNDANAEKPMEEPKKAVD